MDEATEIINYLGTQIKARSGTFDLKEKGKINIRPYEGKIEIMCDCDKETLNELEKIIEQNE
jgi:hypothetical protein